MSGSSSNSSSISSSSVSPSPATYTPMPWTEMIVSLARENGRLQARIAELERELPTVRPVADADGQGRRARLRGARPAPAARESA
jgi:hypothetical protein